MAKRLDKRQRDFCKYKAQGFSNEQSAIKAGYAKTTAKTKSHLLVEKSEIKAEIEKWQNKMQKVIEEKFCYSVEQSFKKLCDIQDLALQTDDKGNYSNLSAAIKAEELKGKMYGLYEADNKQKVSESIKIEIDRNIVKDVINDIDNLADE